MPSVGLLLFFRRDTKCAFQHISYIRYLTHLTPFYVCVCSCYCSCVI